MAQRAYWALLSQRRDQSIVALGRSGAGKTTCCEQVLEHLVGMAGSVDGRVSGMVAHGDSWMGTGRGDVGLLFYFTVRLPFTKQGSCVGY